MKKSGLTIEELELLFEATIDTALATLLDSQTLKLTKAENNCRETTIKALAVLVSGIDSRIKSVETLH